VEWNGRGQAEWLECKKALHTERVTSSSAILLGWRHSVLVKPTSPFPLFHQGEKALAGRIPRRPALINYRSFGNSWALAKVYRSQVPYPGCPDGQRGDSGNASACKNFVVSSLLTARRLDGRVLKVK
jgi:hypothetical protein